MVLFIMIDSNLPGWGRGGWGGGGMDRHWYILFYNFLATHPNRHGYYKLRQLYMGNLIYS